MLLNQRSGTPIQDLLTDSVIPTCVVPEGLATD